MEPHLRCWMTDARAVVLASLAGRRHNLPRHRTCTHVSRFGMAETLRRIEASVHRHGLAVFVNAEQTGPEGSSVRVMVLESSQGGTPVVMRCDGKEACPEAPLSIVVRSLGDDASEVVVPTDFGPLDPSADLPHGLTEELAELPCVVQDALQ